LLKPKPFNGGYVPPTGVSYGFINPHPDLLSIIAVQNEVMISLCFPYTKVAPTRSMTIYSLKLFQCEGFLCKRNHMKNFVFGGNFNFHNFPPPWGKVFLVILG
jgi:hypothetical protein